MPPLPGLLRDLWREAMEDRITGEAARAAYYFFLSFFPMILALFAVTGIFGGNEAFVWIMERLRLVLPGDAAQYLEGLVGEITGDSRPGMLSFGIVFALWSASHMFAVLTDGLNVMYDVKENRPWWKRRLIALGALVASLVLLTTGAAALLIGPDLLADWGLGPAWNVARYPLAFVLLTGLMWLVYYLLPARDQHQALRPVLIGALVGAGLWVLATLGFRFYVAQFGRYSATYGIVGGIIVLLLWLYLTALAILVGGEVAATLEQHARDDWEVGGAPGAAAAAAAAGAEPRSPSTTSRPGPSDDG
ncbi:MAG TPA: YihY/virulence factor BrkB family protein [Thermoanaerobaculia bacterium]|nr:YihY/virulence factor BrkB family protein [Thermoanaerobaculia bacterium]